MVDRWLSRGVGLAGTGGGGLLILCVTVAELSSRLGLDRVGFLSPLFGWPIVLIVLVMLGLVGIAVIGLGAWVARASDSVLAWFATAAAVGAMVVSALGLSRLIQERRSFEQSDLYVLVSVAPHVLAAAVVTVSLVGLVTGVLPRGGALLLVASILMWYLLAIGYDASRTLPERIGPVRTSDVRNALGYWLPLAGFVWFGASLCWLGRHVWHGPAPWSGRSASAPRSAPGSAS